MSEVKIRRRAATSKDGLDLDVLIAQLRLAVVNLGVIQDAYDWRYRRRMIADVSLLINDAMKSVMEELDKRGGNA